MILKENAAEGYPARTKLNAKVADLTVAFAIDFNTAGEKLTKRVSENYIGIRIPCALQFAASTLLEQMEKFKVKTLNIAGNGIYTLDPRYTQEEINLWLYQVLKLVHRARPIEKIVSGGQTGIDFAGGVAAAVLEIEGVMTFPAGYLQKTLKEDMKYHTASQIQDEFDNQVDVLRRALGE